MNIDVSDPAALAEATALAAPRPFGETNTMTLPRGRRAAAQRGMIARVIEAAAATAQPDCTTISIVTADATPLTLTL
jgi:hypothetical protein